MIVPAGLAPPAAAYRAHGESMLVSNACRHLHDTVVWDDISRIVDRQLYAEVPPEVALYLFDVGEAGVPVGPSTAPHKRHRERPTPEHGSRPVIGPEARTGRLPDNGND